MPRQSSRLAAARAEPQVPVVAWERFRNSRGWRSAQGMHKLFVGPTGCGKTILARMAARERRFVVVLGTKPRDSSLDGYVDEGYVRVDEWPPRHELVRENGRLKRRPWKMQKDANGDIRLLLWPEIKNREDLLKVRDVFARFLDDAYNDGSWAIVVDETLWVAKRSGLGLDDRLSALAFMGRSSDITLLLCMQRPRYMDKITWSSISDAYIFHTGVIDDVRELAALGTEDRNQAAMVVQNTLRGHQFLALPCRGQNEGWMVSEVVLDT